MLILQFNHVTEKLPNHVDNIFDKSILIIPVFISLPLFLSLSPFPFLLFLKHQKIIF